MHCLLCKVDTDVEEVPSYQITRCGDYGDRMPLCQKCAEKFGALPAWQSRRYAMNKRKESNDPLPR